MFKKIKRWSKIIWWLIYVILVCGFMGWLGVMTWLALADGKSMNNTYIVNFLSLAIGFSSLPGAFIQLIKITDLNKKQEFSASTQCPKCRHNIEITLIEK